MSFIVGQKIKYARIVSCIIIIISMGTTVHAQPVVKPWGNISGIMSQGEILWFETSIRAVSPGWKSYTSTEKYNWEGSQTYSVEGNVQKISHELQGLPIAFRNTITDEGNGTCTVHVVLEEKAKANLAGVYFCFEVSAEEFYNAKFSLHGGNKTISDRTLKEITAQKPIEGIGNQVTIKSGSRNYTISANENLAINVRSDFIDQPHYLNDPLPKVAIVKSDRMKKRPDYQIYFALLPGNSEAQRMKEVTFTITASGNVDNQPAIVAIDPLSPGRRFDGVGGNFRLQFPGKDPDVIDYCLKNLTIPWGRAAFYWDEWQPKEEFDPIANAVEGKLSKHFYQQMELTKELVKHHVKIIFSTWDPPAWAIDRNKTVPKGVLLDNSKIDKISKSISLFMQFAKKYYGIEADLFSFNETDYGVEIKQFKEEHAFQYKHIGMQFKADGLKTKMLIGDTGAGTEIANRLISDIVTDPELGSYAGAIAFHTYHGCTDEDLAAWHNSAMTTNLPIMVTEGGPNSAAHRYPQIFLNPDFQLEEITTYIGICNKVQPATIMEWQLTSDYSVLTGNGIYGDNGPLRPTQRYWNLKQLDASSTGLYAIPISCSTSKITSAAYFDMASGRVALHFVNNGAERQLTIKNLPKGIACLSVYKTDKKNGMNNIAVIPVQDGIATVSIDAQSFITLTDIKLSI